MITKSTAVRIWSCYQEIEAASKLLAEVEKAVLDRREASHERAKIYNRQFEMGIPNEHGGHRLLDVAPQLALSVIRAHVADQQAKLAEANEQARIEIGMGPV